MKSKFIFFILFLLPFVNQAAFGDEPKATNPQMLIQTTTDEMLRQLGNNKEAIAEDSSIVMNIVEKLLIPHFAANTISRKVLGKHAKTITDEQKKKFSAAFRFYMVRFYSNAFSAYDDETIEYRSAPEYIGKKKVTIKTKLIQSGSKPVAIDYRMQRSGDSWKIIDLKIEGISMVISNRTQFGNKISQDGIDTVIAKLEYKNKKAQSHE
ncbi:MAG: hypothetical protein DRQ47_03565 [Gammaproteobacteria bacterium]|nr:MAG: hypothetical protein DRQ47_03565 [Gammaproteobacteria bacterium]